MDGLIPFCETCGDPRIMTWGSHTGEEGLVRWAMYGCGHTRTRLLLHGAESEWTEILHTAS